MQLIIFEGEQLNLQPIALVGWEAFNIIGFNGYDNDKKRRLITFLNVEGYQYSNGIFMKKIGLRGGLGGEVPTPPTPPTPPSNCLWFKGIAVGQYSEYQTLTLQSFGTAADINNVLLISYDLGATWETWEKVNGIRAVDIKNGEYICIKAGTSTSQRISYGTNNRSEFIGTNGAELEIGGNIGYLLCDNLDNIVLKQYDFANLFRTIGINTKITGEISVPSVLPAQGSYCGTFAYTQIDKAYLPFKGTSSQCVFNMFYGNETVNKIYTNFNKQTAAAYYNLAGLCFGTLPGTLYVKEINEDVNYNSITNTTPEGQGGPGPWWEVKEW